MKKIIVCTIFLFVTISLFSQQINTGQPLTHNYLKKSKTQKTAAWILLGGGVAMIAIAAPGNVSFDILPVLAVGATLSILGSIPLFIAAGKNKRKTMNAFTYLEIQQDPVRMQAGLALRYYPALSLKLNF